MESRKYLSNDLHVLLPLSNSFFREETPKQIALLVKKLGFENLQLCEDSVQDANLRALKTWPFYGVPENPSAWLAQTAKNIAIDSLRRDQNLRQKLPSIHGRLNSWAAAKTDYVSEIEPFEIKDSTLRLIFACCDPFLSPESQIALSLKVLCGLSTAEIASAFLSSVATIEKRIERARITLRKNNFSTEATEFSAIQDRMHNVLKTIYLLFNEGYKASSGNSLVRGVFCSNAIHMAVSLLELPVVDTAEIHALLALMYFCNSRMDSRVDALGNILTLQWQDRSKWDLVQINTGFKHLSMSMKCNELSQYHLEAGIAACHCAAPTYEDTDWKSVLNLYDQLVQVNLSPVVQINRCVPLSHEQGPKIALEELAKVSEQRRSLQFYLVKAELEYLDSNYSASTESFSIASQLTKLEIEKQFINERMLQVMKLSL